MKYENDSDPPHDWDQDEASVMMKVQMPEADGENTFVDVAEDTCSIDFRGKTIWRVKLFRPIAPVTKRITLQRDEVIIHVEKKEKGVEWTSLEDLRNEEEKSGCLKQCNIDHIKNDIFERTNQILNLSLYVKEVVKESIKIDIEPEKLTVAFRTSDENFLRFHKDTDASTVFIWSSDLRDKVTTEKCHYTLKKKSIEIGLHKEKPCKWGSLGKPQTKKVESSPGKGDWVPLKTPLSRNTAAGNIPGPEKKKNNHGAKGGAKSVNQKPTCAVSPLAPQRQGSSKENTVLPIHPPGYTGLDNLGNTCFMNGVLQVLANTRELKDFMLEDNVSQEINYDNPLGTGGQLVASFAVLMKILWSRKYKSYAPSKFKTIIANKASQFMGFAQHDAQEFMDFLLDGLHEDLNRVKQKPYTVAVDSHDTKSDEVIAEESWTMHKRRNDSFISDIFQGQYKSKLVCPVCNKVSITFDPFMTLSVPLPRKKYQLAVYFWSKEVYKKPMRLKVVVPREGDISDLKKAIHKQTGVRPENLRVFEVFKGRIHKFFTDDDAVLEISLNDIIFVSEVLSEKLAGEEVYECVVFQRKSYPSPSMKCSYCHTESRETNTLKRCTRCLKAAYCNQECQKRHWTTHKDACKMIMEPVGMPFMISLPASKATYARICQTMESIARYSTDMFQPPIHSPTSSTATLSHSASHSAPPLPAQVEEPLPTTPTGEGRDQTSVTPPPGKQGEGDGASGEPMSRDSSMDEDDSSMEDVDAELAAEMIVKDSPAQSSDEEDAPRGAVGGARKAKEGVSAQEGVTTASVLGHQQQVPEKRQPLFFIKPCNTQGKGLRGTIGERLKDEGDSPVDLSQYTALAMDWRNDPKQVNHVMVETKPLDYDEDPSCASSEEKKTTLQHCLQLFTEKEKLAPEEAWYCPRCKEHREASKELSLWRLPSILIIQLKRFSFKNFIWRDKIDKTVEFPLRALDLSAYSQVKGGLPVYDLYGVINHHGGILGGHYTAYARLISRENINQNELEWRLFDDSHVTRTTEDSVVSRSAYLLFYRQRRAYEPYVPKPLPPAEPKDQPGCSDPDRSTRSPSAKATASGDDISQGASASNIHKSYDNRAQQKGEEDSSEEEPEVDQDTGQMGAKGEAVAYTNIDEID